MFDWPLHRNFSLLFAIGEVGSFTCIGCDSPIHGTDGLESPPKDLAMRIKRLAKGRYCRGGIWTHAEPPVWKFAVYTLALRPLGHDSSSTEWIKRHQLVPILIWQYLSSSQKESAPNWCLFIYSNCAPERYCQIKIGTNWCRFWYDNISHYRHRRSIGTNWCLFIHSNCAPERYCQIKIGTNWCRFWYHKISHYSWNEEAPIGAELNIKVSLITEWIKRHQLVPI